MAAFGWKVLKAVYKVRGQEMLREKIVLLEAILFTWNDLKRLEGKGQKIDFCKEKMKLEESCDCKHRA